MSRKEQNNAGEAKRSERPAQRRFRYGFFATLLTIAVIAVVIFLNIAAGALEKNFALTIDVTEMNVTDFDEATLQVVQGVDRDVRIYTLYQAGNSTSSRAQVDTVLEKYHALNNRITLGNIDPVREPALVNRYAEGIDLSEGSVIVTNADETRVKVIDRTDYSYTQSYEDADYSFFVLERKVTSALAYVTSDHTPHVYFLSGLGGELDGMAPFSILAQQLVGRNDDVAELNLQTDGATLTQGDAVLLIDPARDLDDTEYNTLRTWLEDGGRLLVSLSYTVDMTRLPNLTRLLAYYQLAYGDGIITENENSTANYWNGNPIYLVPEMDPDHQITAELVETKSSLIAPYARPIADVRSPETGVTYTKLLTSSSRAVVNRNGEVSAPGTQTLALAMCRTNSDPEKEVRVVLLDSYFLLADTNMMYYSYNLNFAVNVFDWLINSDTTVQVPVKYIPDTVLGIPDSSTAWTLAAIFVVGVPLIVLIIGVVVCARRRRL